MKSQPEVSIDGIEVTELMVEEIEIRSLDDYSTSNQHDDFQHRNLPTGRMKAYHLVCLFDF